VIVSQAEIELILNRKAPLRVLKFPVRKGKHGELVKCQVRRDGVYKLKPRVPYDEHREQAALQPTAARAVLMLIDLCEQPVKTVTITVRDVKRAGEEWVAPFTLGDLTDCMDRPRLLTARLGTSLGDYTHMPHRSMRGEQEAPPASVTQAYSREAAGRPARSERAIWLEQRQRIVDAIDAIRSVPLQRGIRKDLELLEGRLQRIDRRLADAASPSEPRRTLPTARDQSVPPGEARHETSA
jgi:hypothetical protein